MAQALLEKSELAHDEVMALLGDNGYRPNEPLASGRERDFERLAPRPAPLPLPQPAATLNEIEGEIPVEDTQPLHPVRLGSKKTPMKRTLSGKNGASKR
jgi:hypothetical protein